MAYLLEKDPPREAIEDEDVAPRATEDGLRSVRLDAVEEGYSSEGRAEDDHVLHEAVSGLLPEDRVSGTGDDAGPDRESEIHDPDPFHRRDEIADRQESARRHPTHEDARERAFAEEDDSIGLNLEGGIATVLSL